ncbi:MAG: energy transducer TonB [Candidatus Rokuibacteriota bacterium]
MKWRIRLPQDPAQRTLALAIVTSVIFHLFLVVPFVLVPLLLQPAQYVKRGEPLLVDLAPERPEEKAPLGNPSRPVAPPPVAPPEVRERPAPSPAPRPAPAPAAQAPRPPAPRPVPAAPAPPQALAKAEPAPEPMIKTPAPTPPPPEPRASETPSDAAASAPPTQPQVAVARPPDSMRRQPGGGGGLLGGGRGGVEGEPIPLDTPEPKYQDYFNKVRERIKEKWTYPRLAGERGIEGELLIEFHIAKDGRLEFIALRNSSGVSILDDYALNAVMLAQPFPPVPDDIAKRTLAINGQFRYQIVSGLVNQFLR